MLVTRDEHRSVGQRGSPRLAIVVAPDRGDRCERCERMQNRSIADVAGMDDEVAAPQRFDRFRAEQSMGVRDQPNANSARRHQLPRFTRSHSGLRIATRRGSR
jgi:hypothetical protein